VNAKNFFAELKRRNVYKVAVAYAIVAWLLIQIATQVFPFFEIPNWTVRLVVLLIAIGFPIALILAWAFELTPEGIRRTHEIEPAPRSRNRAWIYVIVIAGALSIGLFFLGRYTAPKHSADVRSKSIAVLPFVDMSQAKDQEYFCDGISEEILDALAKTDGLRVVARTSSFSFKGKNADVSEVANKLNVENVLEGSLRRNGNRIRITAQLIARDGFHLWSETYDRELQDVFAMQDEITRAIVDALKIKLKIAPPARAQPNTEAYDLYLQGLFFSNKSSEEALRKSLDLFQRALKKDPKLGHAWTGIAKAWVYLADAYVKPLEAYPAAKAAASKALAVDENDTEARCYLAESNRVLDWNLAAAHAEISRAVQSDPNSATAHLFLANVLMPEGEWEQTIAHAREAVKLDPLSLTVSDGASGLCFQTRRYDEAIAESRRAQLLDPGYLYRDSSLAAAYTGKGMYAEALAAYQKIQQAGGGPFGGLAITYAKMGRTDEARRIADELKKMAETRYFAADTIALIYAALGETDEAFKWLDRAVREHSARLQGMVFSPELRPLHSDPRFQNLLQRIGVDPAKVLARDNTP
jgi:serine/threonine-protein kinase